MTKIEWTEKTWNPIVGCSIATPGCINCYAMKMASRIEAMNAALSDGHGLAAHYNGTTVKKNGKAVWTGKLALADDHTLLTPLRRKKPTVYFVNSMGDLFHENAPDEWIDRVFAVMALAPQHTFQVLTKRAERMRRYCSDPRTPRRIHEIVCDMVVAMDLQVVLIATPAHETIRAPYRRIRLDAWPLSNVWHGVSTERQQEANTRIPLLLDTAAAIRFISAEPLLGPLDLSNLKLDRVDLIIVGGESGNAARPMHPAWAISLRDQCATAGVPFFFKQWGEFAPSFPRQSQERNASKQANVAWPDGTIAYGSAAEHGGIGIHLDRMGKAKAGRLLEGVQHDGWPAAAI